MSRRDRVAASRAMSCEHVLEVARGDTPAGTVGELQQKHLLALNLRRARGAISFVPRSYYLPHEDGCRALCDESPRFVDDFMISHAVAILQMLASGTPRLCFNDASVEVAINVCRRYLEIGESAKITDGEWATLSTCELGFAKATTSTVDTSSTRLHDVLLTSQSRCDEVLDLLRSFSERAPELQLGWTATDPGKERRANSDNLGCIFQKYVERPHLVDPSKLSVEAPSRPGESHNGDAGSGTTLIATMHRPSGLYKYNIRLWVDISWSAAQPEAWLYEEGYVEFADSPHTDALDVPTAHISNLSKLGADASAPWCWPTSTYQSFMLAELGTDVYHQRIFPAMKVATREALATVRPRGPPDGVDGKARWKRFGLDFLIDDCLVAWLIECNYNPGMAAHRGRRGDIKRELVRRYYADEQSLRAGRIIGKESAAVASASEAMHGFERLAVVGWQLPQDIKQAAERKLPESAVEETGRRGLR